MSIATMMRLAAERIHPAAEEPVAELAVLDAGRGAGGAEGAGSVAPEDTRPSAKASGGFVEAVDTVLVFVPSEAIWVYVTILSVASPERPADGWVWFLLVLALTPLYVGLNGALLNRKQPGAITWSKGLWSCGFALVAFSSWAAALPGSPFLDISERATQFGAISVVVVASLMKPAAELVGVAPHRG